MPRQKMARANPNPTVSQNPTHKGAFNLVSMSQRRKRVVIACIVVLIIALCAGILVTDVSRIRHQKTGDFEHFFYAADAMHRGQDPYAAHTRGYIYPPLIGFLFQPLAQMTYEHAAALVLLVNVMVTLLAVCLGVDEFLRRFGAPREQLTVFAAMLPALLLNIDKIKGEWQMWQTDVWMLLLFVVALRWIDRLPILAGLALGMAINIKYIPIIFLPYFLIRRRWKAAGGLVIGVTLFALLPAVSTGWNANIRNLGTATSGLLQMVEVKPSHIEAAEVHDVKDSLSCSITSAMARAAGAHPDVGFLTAAAVAILFFTLAWGIYRWHRVGLFTDSTFDARLTGVEWVMLIAVALAFAPQTNTRHLFDALIFTCASSVLLLFGGREITAGSGCETNCKINPGINRWPLLIGTLVMSLGFVLPPGSRTFRGERTPTVLWIRMGGPCWCLMIAAFSLLWSGLETIRGDSADKRALGIAPATSPSQQAL
jgi:hypothetical protein